MSRSEEEARKAWPSGFRPTVGLCLQGFLHGTIVKGDYEKVAALYRANHRVLYNFALLSPGGDAEEAMKIGRLFRRYLVRAEAPAISKLFAHGGTVIKDLCNTNEQCECASACALIWFGAVDRFGEVGLHRPRTTDPRFKAMPPADASVAYKRMLDEISRYLEEMEAPRAMIDAMIATSSAEIRWVNSLDHDGLEQPPSIAEWTDASCGAVTKNESETFADLLGKAVTEREKMLLEFLSQKMAARGNCEFNLFHSHVDRLPPPDH